MVKSKPLHTALNGEALSPIDRKQKTRRTE
jgi:hypothetical protein